MVNSPTAQSLKTLPGKPFGDSANIKLTDMETNIFGQPNRTTDRQTDSQRNEVLFLPPHIFLFLIFSAALGGTFCFAATAQANPKAKQKEPLLPTLYFNSNFTFA
ncbi:MAG: hypothetical protein IPO46_10065 [Chitinophagaceae bacterium]|nr:MAG: hypothetical protein IPO46_10065 [Chitinophagaceae bacterium]